MIKNALENIYISPLEACNLNCKFCYTKKTKNVLKNNQILSFVDRYRNSLKSKNYDLKSILFCGGEVFLLPQFIDLINELDKKGIFVSVITNGTIDKLQEIENPNNCQLLVSLDGPKEIHDKNRGNGNFDKTVNFINHAMKLGFHVEIMFLITRESYRYKDSFNIFNLSKTYLTDRKMSLSRDQVFDIKKKYPGFPNKNFGCFKLSLQSDGLIYGCCESPTPIAKISDDPKIIIDNFLKSLNQCANCSICRGCCDPKFICGYKAELGVKSCRRVVELFQTVD